MTISAGFFGKIPSRGDFIRQGLPPDFIAALDSWWSDVIPASHQRLGEEWTDAWMEAPLWRFALAPNCCGPHAVTGLWLPSTDKAGRLFPLTIAATAPRWSELAKFASFLDAAEDIGLRALEHDLTPEDLTAAIAQAATQTTAPLEEPPPNTSIWWTDGAPRVTPITRRMIGMPNGEIFSLMLKD